MTPEEKSLLERTYKIAEENNEILKSLRRTSRIGVVVKIFYWVILIGTTIGAFYFIQPYIEFITSTFGGNSASGTSASQNYSNFIQDFLK